MRLKRTRTWLLALGISSSLLCQAPLCVYAEEEQTGTVSEISTNLIPGWPQGPEIASSAAVIMEDSTETVLYAKNMDAAMFPASTVKIMTCLLALENSNLEDEVTMTATGVSGVTDGGANIASQLDEIFTMEQCLYAIMVASANDIALQVAEHIGGSVDGFVQMMNTRAQELGCTNTLFTNPTGLPDPNQHTTAHDMALIMKTAMENPTLQKMAGATSYNLPATNKSGGGRVLTSTFPMCKPAEASYFEGCIGGKEGFTEASGSTLVCAAERNATRLICVILGGASQQTPAEAVSLLDYGFQNFQKLSLEDSDFSILTGGTIILPAGSSSDALTTTETETDGEIFRKYLFNGTEVGNATVENVQPQDTSVADAGKAHLQEAKQFSAQKTEIPYYLIGGAGLIIFILLLIRMIKIIKS